MLKLLFTACHSQSRHLRHLAEGGRKVNTADVGFHQDSGVIAEAKILEQSWNQISENIRLIMMELQI